MLAGNRVETTVVEPLMRRTLIILSLAASMVPLGALPSWACSCAGLSRPELGELAEVVFAGQVLSVDQGDQLDVAEVGTDVVHKGKAHATQSVSTASQSPACGVDFQEDQRYTVFATRDGGTLHTNLCSGTRRGDIDPDRFGLHGGRLLARSDRIVHQRDWSPEVWAAAGLALMTLAGAILLRKRVRT